VSKQRSIAAASLVAALALGVAACGSGGSTTGSSGGGDVSTITGAGSTLVLPLVSKWEADYAANTDPSVAITYGGIGSGGGIDQITARTVDFGASDAPLTPDQESACKGCLQIPWALSATSIAYNVSGVDTGLQLTPQLVADIYLGNVTTWDDPAIAKLNPGVKLPSTKITPIYRSDGSGDTYALTDLLSKVSPEWKSKVGTSTLVKFPTGTGAEHNDGVAAALGQTDGGIAYMGAAYVSTNSLDEAALQNEAGNYEEPTVKTIAAAADTVKSVPADNAISITDPPASAKDAYPLSTFTYAIVPQDSDIATAMKAFLTYAIDPKKGQSFGPDLDFAPLPSQVLAADKATIAKIGS
jgi:phosphate transport system substrate-binding protein